MNAPSPPDPKAATTPKSRGTPRRRRSDGERSRQAILTESAALASVIGLEGLSVGVLAERLGMSKSGLYAHFGSKEELELATIEAAREVFGSEVLEPGLGAGLGLTRLRALYGAFFAHLRQRRFPGGCFFASVAAEFDARTGPVRDRIAACLREWSTAIDGAVRQAVAAGELPADLDIGQVTFEIEAMLGAANAMFTFSGDAAVLDKARAGIEGVLARRKA
jgi:AcrR family transcriptional regulator